jgi:hypothetical protein
MWCHISVGTETQNLDEIHLLVSRIYSGDIIRILQPRIIVSILGSNCIAQTARSPVWYNVNLVPIIASLHQG